MKTLREAYNFQSRSRLGRGYGVLVLVNCQFESGPLSPTLTLREAAWLDDTHCTDVNPDCATGMWYRLIAQSSRGRTGLLSFYFARTCTLSTRIWYLMTRGISCALVGGASPVSNLGEPQSLRSACTIWPPPSFLKLGVNNE